MTTHRPLHIRRLIPRAGKPERDCRICGGAGWTDGSAELRRDGRRGDTTCLGCAGSGKEPANPRRCRACGDELPASGDSTAARGYCRECY